MVEFVRIPLLRQQISNAEQNGQTSPYLIKDESNDMDKADSVFSICCDCSSGSCHE